MSTVDLTNNGTQKESQTDAKYAASKRNAILIIHGVGQQSPLETLDEFSRNFMLSLNRFYQLKGEQLYRAYHQQSTAPADSAQEELWLENYIALESSADLPDFDIFEYYWAHKMTGQASFDDIKLWFKETTENALDFYNDADKLASPELIKNRIARDSKKEKKRRLFDDSGKMLAAGYIRYFPGFLFALFGILESSILKRFPIIDSIYQSIKKYLQTMVIDYVGDVAVYTAIDRKSKHNNVRREIIKGASREILGLSLNQKYAAVYIAGHSLGSVIAYDALSKTNKYLPQSDKLKEFEIQCDKIKGLITFGSPLDKIAFFFRQKSKENAYFRKQLIENIYSFKKLNMHFEHDSANLKLEDQTKSNLKNVKWLNYYHYNDPICGYLEVYAVDSQLSIKKEHSWGLEAHSCYWNNQQMYDDILKNLADTFIRKTN